MPARRKVTLGLPAISTPRQGDEGAVSRGFDNTRERIEALEREAIYLGQLLEGNSSVQDLLALRAQVAKIIQQINVLNAQASGPTYAEFNQDLGVGRSSGTFDITGLSNQTAGKFVNVQQTAAAIASKGGARDEGEMDSIIAFGYVQSTTTIRVYWRATGVVVGTYAFAYIVSN